MFSTMKSLEKQLLTLMFLITMCVGINGYDIFLGYPDRGSKTIYSQVHQENPAIWVRSEEITVNCSRNEVINAIQITDLRPDKWGEAYVKAGGIGQQNVTIELDSPSIFRGYNFWVQVFAIETNNFFYSHGRK